MKIICFAWHSVDVELRGKEERGKGLIIFTIIRTPILRVTLLFSKVKSFGDGKRKGAVRRSHQKYF